MNARDVEQIESFYNALTLDADEASVRDLVDPEIEWFPPPQAPIPGPFRGLAGVLEAADHYRESFDEFRSEPERILEGSLPGQYVVLAITTVRGKGSGAEVRTEVAHLIEMRGDRIVRFEVVPDRDAALRAAGVDAGA